MADVITPPAPPVVDATPNPNPNPTPTPEPDAFGAIDKMVQDNPPADPPADPKPAPAKNPAPAKTPAPAKNPAPAKQPAPAKNPAPAKQVSAPDPKPGDKPADVKLDLLEDIPPNSPGWFRTHYDKAKTTIKNLQAELEKVKTAAPKGDDPEIPKLREALTAREKRAQELEEHIRFVDYTKSEEFKTKYHDPYVNTSKDATAQVAELRITNPDGTLRAATNEDFWSIVQIPNNEEALAAAEKLFGSPAKANFVMSQRERVRQAWSNAEQAKEEYRVKGAERAKTQQAEYERATQEATAKWNKLNSETVEGNPEIYQPEDGDDEGNELLVKGFERADAAFGGQITDPETGKKRAPTPDEMIAINSEVRNKAAAFDRMFHRATKYQSRIAELEAQIAEYEKSGPGGGAPPSGGDRKVEDDFDSHVDRIAAAG